MQENQTQNDEITLPATETAADRLQKRLAANLARFLGLKITKGKLPYSGAQHRGDGFDDFRLAKAQAKRERRQQRNLSNGLPR